MSNQYYLGTIMMEVFALKYHIICTNNCNKGLQTIYPVHKNIEQIENPWLYYFKV